MVYYATTGFSVLRPPSTTCNEKPDRMIAANYHFNLTGQTCNSPKTRSWNFPAVRLTLFEHNSCNKADRGLFKAILKSHQAPYFETMAVNFACKITVAGKLFLQAAIGSIRRLIVLKAFLAKVFDIRLWQLENFAVNDDLQRQTAIPGAKNVLVESRSSTFEVARLNLDAFKWSLPATAKKAGTCAKALNNAMPKNGIVHLIR